MPLILTEEMRSMIASAVVAGGDCNLSGTPNRRHLCLCCAADATAACAQIVGTRYAARLQDWAYDALGCGFNHEDIRRDGLGMELIGAEREATYLERVAELDEI